MASTKKRKLHDINDSENESVEFEQPVAADGSAEV